MVSGAVSGVSVFCRLFSAKAGGGRCLERGGSLTSEYEEEKRGRRRSSDMFLQSNLLNILWI